MRSSFSRLRVGLLLQRLRPGRLVRLWHHLDKRPLVAAGLFGAISLLAVTHIRPGPSYRVGDLARAEVVAPFDHVWTNDAATEEVRAQARRSAPKQYTAKRGEAREAVLARVNTLFDRVDEAAQRVQWAMASTPADGAPPSAESGAVESPRDILRRSYAALTASEYIDLSYRAFVTLVALPEPVRSALRTATARALSRINDEQDLRSDEVDQFMGGVRRLLSSYADERAFELPPDQEAAEAFVDAAAACVLPNLEYSAEATMEAREAAAQAVQPVLTEIRKGEVVLTKHQRVTEADLVKLEKLGLTRARMDWPVAVLTVVFVFAGLCSAALVLHLFEPGVLAGARQLGAISGLVLFPALVLNLVAGEQQASYFAFALGLFATLAGTVLLSVFSATIVAGALLLVGTLILQPTNVVGLASLLIGAVTGMVVAKRLTYAVAQIFPLGLVAGLVALAATLLAEMIFRRDATQLPLQGPNDLVHATAWSLAAGLAGVFGGHSGSRWLEHPLGTVTEMRLLELSDPRQPVLQELLAKAPGTYHGSLIVSSLAGNAAQAAGQTERETLLVRVGGLYHDIGKLRRPHMFVENQHGGHNPHDGIAPALSARAIMSHITDGIELAQIHRLPTPVADCIREHHGTTLISYFYQRAVESGDPDIEEAQFRYPGPKPRSAVTGILMLADGVEAAVRALRNPTRQMVQETVMRIVRSRFEDGQLDECPLTIRQIRDIESSMIQSLLGIFHARIEYPKPTAAPGSPSSGEHGSGVGHA